MRSGRRAASSTRRRSADLIGCRAGARLRPPAGPRMALVPPARKEMAVDESGPRTVARAPRASLVYDPTIRAIVFQVLIAAGLIAFVAWIADNTISNLSRV